MQYPLVLKAFNNGVKLYIPDPVLVKPTYESLRLENPATLFPFWAKVWPSAVALSSFLEQYQEFIKNKTVLEIGAGIGLPSFSIAEYVAEITITDYDLDAIELLQKNIAYFDNHKINAICADWDCFPISICADVVLLSDTNYAPSAFDSLLRLIQTFLQIGATIIIATPMRITANPFIEKLEMHVTQKDLIELTYNGESSLIGLFVLKQNRE